MTEFSTVIETASVVGNSGFSIFIFDLAIAFHKLDKALYRV
eukprot:CAMPEP_0183736098 /NCGR_PEP_ID=MMETSP0737-20130205/48476_1 /TAXON_ID=385413 /ORGANISM="Thalassiosira miniscula, Strain CCMP1093" /LENGTH=40 /DNA_ID= /DNA_START= /DNA_END= /DNA_ORIENTATION=